MYENENFDEDNRDVGDVQFDFDNVLNELKKREDEIATTTGELASIKEQLNELIKLEATLRVQKTSLDERLWRQRADKRDLENKQQQLMREQEVAEQKQRLVIQFEEKSKYLDDLTSSAKWREFAFDHQIVGGKRLAVAKRGILADKRGLGKTLTSLIYCDMVEAQRVLVIAPNDVVDQFEKEIRNWAPSRRIMSLSGLNPTSRTLIYPMLRSMDSYILTLNYEAWRRDKTIIDKLVDLGLDTVVLDEAHRIKEASKVTARGVFQIVHAKNRCNTCCTTGSVHGGAWAQKGGMIKDVKPWSHPTCEECGNFLEATVKNVLSMTGTPFLNRPQELFSLLFLINPKAFPDSKSFLRDYCFAAAPNRWKFLPGGEARLVKKMEEFFVQRDRNDAGITIPPPAIIHHEVVMDEEKYPEQFAAYRRLNDAAVLILEKGQGEAYEQNSILSIINHSRHMQVWPHGINVRDPETKEVVCKFDIEESAKLDAVEELCREFLEEGIRFIVWSMYKSGLYELKRRLSDWEANGSGTNGSKGKQLVVCTGDQALGFRNHVGDDFDLKYADPERYEYQACFATYQAFGTGKNLNAATQAIAIDDVWNPGTQDQAIGRIDRMNNTEQATYHIFRVKGTIDSFMEALIEEKRDMTEDFSNVVITATDLLNAIRNGDM